MAISFNDNIKIQANKPLEFKFGPFTSISEANTLIPIAQRVHGLVFGIYTNPGDIANSDIEFYYYYSSLSDTSYKRLIIEQDTIDALSLAQNANALNPVATLADINIILGNKNRVIFGGVPQWTGTGLGFYAPYTGYIIEGVYYEDGPETITLTAADPSNPRRDRFILSSTGWGFITGTPQAIPVAEQINSITQIDKGDVLIGAGATIPTVTNENVYINNTQWTTSSGGTGTFNPASTTAPFSDTVSFEATNVQNGGYMQFTAVSDFNVSSIGSLGMQVRLKSTMNNGRNLRIQFFNNSDVAVSQSVILPLVKSTTGVYQFSSLGKNDLGFTTTTVRKLRITYFGSGGSATYSGFFVDNVIIGAGVTPPTPTVFTQDEIDAIKNANSPSALNPFLTGTNIKTVNGNSLLGSGNVAISGLPVGGTINQVLTKLSATDGDANWQAAGGISGSGTVNEIAYFTGASAIASLPVATYPSLTELSYVKGVTSALQGQINGKQATIAGTLTDTYVATIVAGVPTWAAASGGGGGISGLTTNKIPKATSATTIGDSGITQESTISYLIGSRTGTASTTPQKVSFGASAGTNAAGGAGNLKWLLYDDGLASGQYGIGMSAGIMEVVVPASAAISFYNNGVRAMSLDSNASTLIGTGNTNLNLQVTGRVIITSANSQRTLSLGGSFSGGTRGAQANAKLIVYESPAGSNIYGFAVSSSWLEVITPSGGNIGFYPSGVEVMTLTSAGNMTLGDASNLQLGATTGSKIGTATTQKIAFWNKTPIIQPTNAITASAFVANTSGTLNDTATFGGYTIGQIAAALINSGLLA